MSHSGDKSSPRKKVDLIFGKYELETKIGEGSFGIVYQGIFRNKEVAIKRMKESQDTMKNKKKNLKKKYKC